MKRADIRFKNLDIAVSRAQEVELEILLEFDRICKENDIKYQLFAGTLLGAIRHKGFISWDDDIDVCMLRSEYDKFLKVTDNYINTDYFIQTFKSDREYTSLYAKMRKNNTRYVEEPLKDSHIHHGIYIDIFPFDNIRYRTFSGNVQRFLIDILRKTYQSRNKNRINFTESKLEKVRILASHYLMKLIPNKLMYKTINNLMKVFNDEETEYVGELSFSTDKNFYHNYALKKEVFYNTIEWEFEGHSFPIPKEYHHVLSKNYGDYMTPPPESEQFPGHNIIEINFNLRVSNIISKILDVNINKIKDIESLKKGMTNRSLKFKLEGKNYILRIPGEGTQNMIDRHKEYEVYEKLEGYNLTDNIIHINPDTGYKISEFIEGARCCDPYKREEVEICMDKLKKLHRLKLKVGHDFDLFKQIEYYESLRKEDSIYDDYEETKKKVYELKGFIDGLEKERILCHIDSNPDNFLLTDGEVRLIDWEYAGMQDPHIDIAMFAIYALYNREEVDELINIYFDYRCEDETRIKVYSYIAACGLLWSNWCEYKRELGIEFGEYSLLQYKYAKDYYNISKKESGNAYGEE